MNLRRHEQFEIEVLDRLAKGRFLSPLLFGGGTMLRLCWGMPRYSLDLDFWFVKTVDVEEYFNEIREYLSEWYEITDAEMRPFSLLIELRSSNFDTKLKLEIRKETVDWDWEQKIAFSPYTEIQVLVKAITLKQALVNKALAGLDRKNIRDFFDLEFIVRQGVELELDKDTLLRLKRIAESFKGRDFSVVLGSLLEKEMREYYKRNRFSYLIGKINERLSMLI